MRYSTADSLPRGTNFNSKKGPPWYTCLGGCAKMSWIVDLNSDHTSTFPTCPQTPPHGPVRPWLCLRLSWQIVLLFALVRRILHHDTEMMMMKIKFR